LLIRQPLARDALQGFFGASIVINAKGNAMVVPEVKFRKVAVQMEWRS
jgi:hypothetical protein